MQRPGRARVLRPRVELEGGAPLLRGDHPHADQVADGRARNLAARRSAAGARASRQQHRADHVAALHRLERIAPALERRRARDHAGEVELAFERPLREPREVLLRQVVAAVRDEDRASASRTAAAGRAPPSRRRARGRSGRTCRPSRAGRAPARRSSGGATTSKTKSTGPGSVCVAPNRVACSSFRSSRSIARISAAPAMRAPWITDSPTAPQPITATRAPSQTFAVSSTDMTPVATAQPIRHACSDGQLARHLHRGDRRDDRVRRERPGAQHRRQHAAVVAQQPAGRSGRLLALPRRAAQARRRTRRRRSSSRARRGRRARARRRRRRPPRSCPRPRGRAASGTGGPSRPPRSRAGRCGRRRSPRSGRAPRPAPARRPGSPRARRCPRAPRTTPRSATTGRDHGRTAAGQSASLRSISAIRFWISSSTPRCPPTASA